MPSKDDILEARLEAHLRNRVRCLLRGKVIKMIPVVAGVPDRLVMLSNGRLFLVELKTHKGKRSAIQQHWHDQAAEMGHTVYTLSGRDEIDAWVNAQVAAYDPPPLRPGRKPEDLA